MRYLKPLRPFLGWSQLSVPTVYDDSLSYYEVLNKCIFHFNEMLKIMQENYEIIDEAFAKILEECEAAIARCEEAAARAEAAQSAAEKAQAAAEAAQAAAEAAQKLAEAAQAAAEAARDDAVTAQKAAEAAQAAAEAAQAAAEAAQQKAETAQAAAEAAQAKAEDAQEKAESARDAAEAAQTSAESAQQKAEDAQTAAESARDAAEAAQTAAESARDAAQEAQASAENARDEAQAAQGAAESARDEAQAAQKKAEAAQEAAEVSEQAAANSATNAAASASNAAESASSAASDATNAAESAENASNSADQAAESATDASNSAGAAHTSETNAADSAADAAASAEEIKNALDNYYDKTESKNTFVKKAGDTMTGNLVMNNSHVEGASSAAYFNSFPAELTDLNNLNINGYFISRENLTNAPNFEYYLLYNNIVSGSNHITQIAFQRITGNNIATRNFNSNTSSWSNWTYFTTQSDITDNYLPLSGGTMTGNIVMDGDSYIDGRAVSIYNGVLINTNENTRDLNNYKTNGFFRSSSSYTYKNTPVENMKIFLLIVNITQNINNFYFGYQILINLEIKNNNTIYFRRINQNETWENWKQFTMQNDIEGNYLPLSGGTMTGNILGSKDSFTPSNNAYFDGFSSGLIIHPISEGNPDINSVAEPGIYYTSNSLNNFSNIPEDIRSLSWYMITKYPNGGISVLLHELTSGKIYVTKGGVYESEKITPNSWVRLDNVTEEPTNGTPIFYKRVYSTDNKFFANIYKIAGDEKKAKVDIYANNLNSEFNLSFSTDFQTFPAIFKIDETQSNFNAKDLPLDLKTSMDLVIGNYMVEKSSRYIGLVNLNYIIGFSGSSSYIKPYFNGILLESSVLSKSTISGTYPVFITSFINNVKSSWSWD